MNLSYLEFDICENKTSALVRLVFEPCEKFIASQIEHLITENARLDHSNPDDVNCIYINGTRFIRLGCGVCGTHVARLLPEMEEKGQKFLEFFQQTRRDMKFLKMWLSQAIVSGDLEASRQRLPEILAKMSPTYQNIPCDELKIPEGKEALWKKAENIISYYLGLSLVL